MHRGIGPCQVRAIRIMLYCTRNTTPSRCRRAITLIETIVLVIVLVAVLCAVSVLLLRARASSRRMRCEKNMAELGVGLLKYANADGDRFPAATVPNDALPPEKRLSWYVQAWAAVGESQTELLIDRAQAWDAADNLEPTLKNKSGGPPRSAVIVPGFRCPADYHRQADCRPGPTTYPGIAGVGAEAATLPLSDPMAGVWGYDRRTPLEAITDGRRTTLLVAETVHDTGPWTAGGRPTVRGVDPNDTPCLGPKRPLGGLHAGGANMLFVDGDVRFLADAIDRHVLAAMCTIAGAPEEESEQNGSNGNPP